MDQKNFGKYFSSLRKKSGFKSQRQLATAAGFSNATIARIEEGSQKTKPETLKILSQFLNISYETLMEKAGYLDHLTYHEKEDVFAEGTLMEFVESQIENYLRTISINNKFSNEVKNELLQVLDEFDISYEKELTPEDLIEVSKNSIDYEFKVRMNEVLQKLIVSLKLLEEVDRLESKKNPIDIFNKPDLNDDLYSIVHFINQGKDINGNYVITENALLKNREAFAVKVLDNSLINDGILEGDVVICVKEKDTEPSDISVVSYYNDEILLRKVRFYEEFCLLFPSNSSMQPEIIEDVNSIEIIGKVIQMRRNFE